MSQNATEFASNEHIQPNLAGLINNNILLSKNAKDLAREKVGYVEYAETRDPELISVYTDIRERAYREKLGLKEFDGRLDRYDSTSNIVLAVKNNEIIGGLRLTIHDSVINTILPSEEDGFIFRELLPELDLDKNSYAECSRMAFKEGYRNGRYSASLYGKSFEVCRLYKVKYYFFIAPAEHIRCYTSVVKRNFNLDIITRSDIKVPEKRVYKEIKSEIYLAYITL